jgi:hypothetical protein
LVEGPSAWSCCGCWCDLVRVVKLEQIAKEHPNIPPRELGKALEKAKKAGSLRVGDDTVIDPRTGEIYDKQTGEHIGNIFD